MPAAAFGFDGFFGNPDVLACNLLGEPASRTYNDQGPLWIGVEGRNLFFCSHGHRMPFGKILQQLTDSMVLRQCFKGYIR